MNGQLVTTEYRFWLVVLLFYVFSNIRLISKSQLLFTETVKGQFKPTFVFSSFEIRGRQVQLLNLLVPFTGFLTLRTLPNHLPSADFETTSATLVRLQKAITPFKVISCVSFFYLVLGPVLTLNYGLGAALLLLLPLHIAVLLCTLILLLIKKRALDLRTGELAAIFFDCLVVPSYLPNIVRKIYTKKNFLGDGFYFALQTCTDAERDDLRYSIARKIEQMSLYVDESDLKNYSSYKKLLEISDEQ